MTICRYSEAQFKALKYRDGFPVQFGSIRKPAHDQSLDPSTEKGADPIHHHTRWRSNLMTPKFPNSLTPSERCMPMQNNPVSDQPRIP